MFDNLKIRVKYFFCLILLISQMYNGVSQNPVPLPLPYSSEVKVNYVRLWHASSPQLDPNQFIHKPLRDVKEITNYFDGLGRPIQMVIKEGSLPSGGIAKDLVTTIKYDEFGRQNYQYLPFPSTSSDGLLKLNAFGEQSDFYSLPNTDINPISGQGEAFFYGESIYESSSLNRITEVFAPGNSWAGSSHQVNEANRHSIKFKYWSNTSTDGVRIWNVTHNPGGFAGYSSPGAYPAGELYKNVRADEHNKQVIE